MREPWRAQRSEGDDGAADTDGIREGVVVGFFDGMALTLGLALGKDDGMAEGDIEGEDEGALEGPTLGSDDGAALTVGLVPCCSQS